MTSFKITNDDVGARSLQELNKKPRAASEVQQTKPSNPVQKSPENNNRGQSVNPGQEYVIRNPKDRRQHNQQVVLDTRSQEDRRHNKQASEEESKETSAEENQFHHIDEIV